MRAPEGEFGFLEAGIRCQVTLTAGERVVAGPERHAALRCDEHEPLMYSDVAQGPRCDDQDRGYRQRDGQRRAPAEQEPADHQRQVKQHRRPDERR